MYRLEKKFRFEASHVLPHHDGKCARLHGHSWVGVVILEGEELQTDGPQQGMLIDFGSVSWMLESIVEESLDHRHLNDTVDPDSPTSEIVAMWVYRELKMRMREKGCASLLKAVRIEETCTSAAEYRP